MTDRVYAEIEEKTEEEDKSDTKQATSFNGVAGNSSNTDSTEHNSGFPGLPEFYQPSGSDSGNGSGDSIQTNASDARE